MYSHIHIFLYIGLHDCNDKVNPTPKLEPTDQQVEGYEEEEQWLSKPMQDTGHHPMDGLVAPDLHPKCDIVAGSR